MAPLKLKETSHLVVYDMASDKQSVRNSENLGEFKRKTIYLALSLRCNFVRIIKLPKKLQNS